MAYKLKDKIKESDDPNACLLTICDIFESDDVDNAILKKHGENMRASISSKTHSITILSKHFVLIDGTAATSAQVSTVTPSAPPFPSATTPRTNELSTCTIEHIYVCIIFTLSF